MGLLPVVSARLADRENAYLIAQNVDRRKRQSRRVSKSLAIGGNMRKSLVTQMLFGHRA
jgi:hypothetical protein